MQNFGGNFSFNSLPIIRQLGSKAKEALTKLNPNANKGNQEANLTQQAKSDRVNQPQQSLTNTNSNININQPTQTSPAVTQTALNAANKPQEAINQNQNDAKLINNKPDQAAIQGKGAGAKDLPSYAGVPNMSMQSWIANQQDKSFAKLESGDKELKATLEGIKGFQKQNSEGGMDQESGGKQGQGNKQKMLTILSHIFSSSFKSGMSETEVLSSVISFKKLGKIVNDYKALEGKSKRAAKEAPPLPNELQSLEKLSNDQVKQVSQLLSLPDEFPEGLRTFAKERIYIDSIELKNFLEHRLKIVQSQLFEGDPALNRLVEQFAPLLSQGDNFLLMTFILLYYPLPLPITKTDYDFLNAWNRKGAEEEEELIASCEIYYQSNKTGRVLAKLKLDKNREVSLDVQTEEDKESIVNDIERSVAEIMILLETPPDLSELNVMVSKQIYEATDLDEELSIVSSGPLRLEILLGVYAILIILNRMNEDQDPAGTIQMQ